MIKLESNYENAGENLEAVFAFRILCLVETISFNSEQFGGEWISGPEGKIADLLWKWLVVLS
jgi:hypothetical protein